VATIIAFQIFCQWSANFLRSGSVPFSPDSRLVRDYGQGFLDLIVEIRAISLEQFTWFRIGIMANHDDRILTPGALSAGI
jgi:hypothetical protein